MPKIKYKLLPRRRRRCATQRCVCKIVERIKKSRMHATTMDNVAQGENQCNSRQQSRFPDDVLANANVDAIILPAHSPVAIVLLLQGSNTYIGPGSHRQKATSSLSLSLSFSSLPFPCSVVAKCNHCNRFCTISNVHSALKTLLLWLCSFLRGCCCIDAAAAAVATVERCWLPPGVVFIPLRLQLIVARAKARGVFFKKNIVVDCNVDCDVD